MTWNQAAFVILQSLRLPSRSPMKCKGIKSCLQTAARVFSWPYLFLLKLKELGLASLILNWVTQNCLPGACWRKRWTASSFYPSLGHGQLHAFGKANFVLTIPAIVFRISWEAATMGQEPLCYVTGCPSLYPCFLHGLCVLSEEVLDLGCHKYSRCSYRPCNLGYYP